MKVAVCDDNKVMLEFLSRYIAEDLTYYGVTNEMSSFTKGEDFMKQHKSTPFDVVFLDIKMPDIDGFAAAKCVREISEKTYIIFVTTESSLVFDCFEYQPFYFIPKGNTEFLKAKLKSVVGKLAELLKNNYPICLEMPHGEKKYVRTDEVRYVLSKSNYLDIVCKSETIHIRRKIDNLLEELPQKAFARINNRIIVNMGFVGRVDNTRMKVTLYDGTELNISRTYKAEFSEKYNIYLRNYS